jgi:hypothetical protein
VPEAETEIPAFSIQELNMRTLAKIVGAILVCLVALLVVVRITGFGPIGNTPGRGNYPGLWLSGTVVNTPVTDWSFVSQFKTDKVETRTWYGIPHSVTTSYILHNGQLYITSMFAKGVPFPGGKSWVNNVMRDPHVRLKFGDSLYDCTLSHVTDHDELAAVLGERAVKNPQLLAADTTDGPVLHLFHVLPQ